MIDLRGDASQKLHGIFFLIFKKTQYKAMKKWLIFWEGK
jgi:hypothetical protein